MFSIASKIVSVFSGVAIGNTSSVLLESTTDLVETQSFMQETGSAIAKFLYTILGNIILAISQFGLMFIDLLQLIVYKFLGIGIDVSNYNGLDPNNPLIKFLTNKTVITVLRSVLSVALVFVILFSIFSIIMGEYNKAANDQEYSVKRIWARALRALLSMFAFPIAFLVIVILTNSILSGFSYALSGNATYSIGGQVIATVTYDANTYRNYANNNKRVPICINFDDPYDNGTYKRYSNNELVEIYDSFAKEGKNLYNAFAANDFLSFNDSVVYSYQNNSIINDSYRYKGYEKFFCTAEQYYVMADFIDYALTHNITYYYKPITDPDISWKYVDTTVFDTESQTLKINYRDANNLNDGKTYSVSYKASSYELNSPIQDAQIALSTLLSLDGNYYQMLDYLEDSINRVQWATNKVRVRLSENYNDTTKWTASDQILLYEYYRYKYNNTFQNYSIHDLLGGVDIDVYEVSCQYYRTYASKYVDLVVEGEDTTKYKVAIINGNYYKITELLDSDKKVVLDDYGDPIYTLDTQTQDKVIIYNLDNYNSTLSEDDKLGVYFDHSGHYYSTVYDSIGKELPKNMLNQFWVNTTGELFEEETEDDAAKYGFRDLNGIWHTVDRIFAKKYVKQVSWPEKFVGDLMTIYRNLNLSQLITTGQWLDAFNCDIQTDENGRYVASFDTSLISPQGLIFSEIFLNKIEEDIEGVTTGDYIFTSKYSDEQLYAMTKALVGEDSFETASTNIKYFAETFNILFEPLLEQIMKGEGQTMKEGEIESIQLYTYKAFLCSALLSSDSARFFLDLANSIVKMYAFGYDIARLQSSTDTSFAVTVLNEYADDAYGTTAGKIPYLINLEEYGIIWQDYVSDEIDGEQLYDYLVRLKGTKTWLSLGDLPSNLVNIITTKCANEYKEFAEVVLDDTASGDLLYGLRWRSEDNRNLAQFLGNTYSYDNQTGYITYQSKVYHSWKQLPNYADLKSAVTKIVNDEIEEKNDDDEYKSNYHLVQLAFNAFDAIEAQGLSLDDFEYVELYIQYLTGELSNNDILMSSFVSTANAAGLVSEYDNYLSRLDLAKANYINSFDNLTTTNQDGIAHETLVNTYYGDANNSPVLSKQDYTTMFETYYNGVISDNKDNYIKQLLNYDKFTRQFEEIASYGNNLDKNSETKTFQYVVSAMSEYLTALKNAFGLQKTVYGLQKYFLTYAVRMSTTEQANKSFNVVVNNHAYSLFLSMPTAKIAEYVVGGTYLNKMGFETVFVNDRYTGFLDIGYDQAMPGPSDKVEFTTINNFVNNLATITVQSFYNSNLYNLVNRNNDLGIIKDLHYGVSNGQAIYIAPTTASYEDQPTYMVLLLKEIVEKGMLGDEIIKEDDLYKDSAHTNLQDNKTIEKLFNDTMEYILGSYNDYASMTMQSLRLEMLNAIYSYTTYSGDTAEQDSARFLTLFNLFCSDISIKQFDGDLKSVEYETDNITKGIILKLVNMQDKPEELLVNLQYENLYGDIGYDEAYGDYFIICTYNEELRTYFPFLMSSSGKLLDYKNTNTKQWLDDYGYAVAYTSYYVNDPQTKKAASYPVIAKGIMTEDGLPTAIRQKNGITEFYRKDLVIRNASELGLSTYYVNIESISTNMSLVSKLFNSVTKAFTGKSLVERAYEGKPRFQFDTTINIPIGTNTENFTLTSEAIEMNYSFNRLGGLSSQNFYTTIRINFLVLIVALFALIPIMIKALFGVFGRVLDITCYYVLSPVAFSTIALGKDVKTKKDKTEEQTPIYSEWLKQIMKKTISVFAYVIAFQMFFIVMPFISGLELIKSTTVFDAVPLFSGINVNFVNMVVRLLFTIATAYLIVEAPKVFADIMGQTNGIDEGEKVKKAVTETIDDVRDTISGKKMVNTVNFATEQLKSAIPGYDLAQDAIGNIKKVGATVVGKVAEAYLVAQGVPKETAKKATKAFTDAIKQTEDAKKMMREKNRMSAEMNYYKQIGITDAKKDKAGGYPYDSMKKQIKDINDALKQMGYDSKGAKEFRKEQKNARTKKAKDKANQGIEKNRAKQEAYNQRLQDLQTNGGSNQEIAKTQSRIKKINKKVRKQSNKSRKLNDKLQKMYFKKFK